MKTFCILLTLVTLFVTSRQDQCHTSQLDMCMSPIFLNARRELVPVNAKALEKRCQQKKKMWKCIDNFMEKCLADVHHLTVNLIMDDARQVMEEWCEDGSPLQKEYLKIGSCLSEAVKNTHRLCLNNLESVVYQVTGNDVDLRIPAGCCYFNRFYGCMFDQVEKSCGKKSFHVVEKLSRMMKIPCARKFCSSYDPASDLCLDLSTRNVTYPSEKNSYLARFFITMMKYRS